MTTTISLEAIEEIHFEATQAAEQAAALGRGQILPGKTRRPGSDVLWLCLGHGV
jgi:hypothetical protein